MLARNHTGQHPSPQKTRLDLLHWCTQLSCPLLQILSPRLSNWDFIGFDIDAAKDEQGTPLLMTAVQNGNKKAVDVLIRWGSALNHFNGNGNTTLNYALTYSFAIPSLYDTTGEIATAYFIEQGADDTIKKRQGLSAYGGLGDDEPETSDTHGEEGCVIDMIVAASV